MLLNKKMTFTVVEQLPKDKSAVLGTAELALFPHFFRTAPAPVATADSAATPRSVNTVLRQWVPLVKPGESGATSEIEVEVNMSRPIIEADALEGGNMMTLKIEDMVNLPEEWSLKEGSDKDPHSSRAHDEGQCVPQ